MRWRATTTSWRPASVLSRVQAGVKLITESELLPSSRSRHRASASWGTWESAYGGCCAATHNAIRSLASAACARISIRDMNERPAGRSRRRRWDRESRKGGRARCIRSRQQDGPRRRGRMCWVALHSPPLLLCLAPLFRANGGSAPAQSRGLISRLTP
jgi:hypothetical protein